ncbi:MAG TPA: NUDIX hydrolase [Hydrogenophaga sp.]|uniref:NUDIX hydrolase n=1 Tax=Hydrogenophaga sp. TaxID=1904254 RepID=UPI002B5EC523|nr:NUDIX hydrolase [Hydrogenophaga sp.]HMN94804.1 NUDIX hydrolase [Hydrogenophaga sp.]
MAIPFFGDVVDTPPLPSATVMLLRDGAPGLQVLLMRRHGNTAVLGGVHVFPGGKLDPTDLLDRADAVDLSGALCRQRLAEPELEPAQALALHLAALRETFEECGLLPGSLADAAQLAALRERTLAGTNLCSAASELGLGLKLSALLPWSRWITPRQPSVSNKRFDTRFFVALAPPEQDIVACARETTEVVWMTPRTALERYWAGDIDLAPPQIMSLSHLTRLGGADAVLDHARTRPPALIAPEPFDEDGVRVICYPGDPAHSQREAAWPGPTRLRFRNRRFEPEGGLDELLG